MIPIDRGEVNQILIEEEHKIFILKQKISFITEAIIQAKIELNSEACKSSHHQNAETNLTMLLSQIEAMK